MKIWTASTGRGRRSHRKEFQERRRNAGRKLSEIEHSKGRAHWDREKLTKIKL